VLTKIEGIIPALEPAHAMALSRNAPPLPRITSSASASPAAGDKESFGRGEASE